MTSFFCFETNNALCTDFKVGNFNGLVWDNELQLIYRLISVTLSLNTNFCVAFTSSTWKNWFSIKYPYAPQTCRYRYKISCKNFDSIAV